jgi:hypothetical protein
MFSQPTFHRFDYQVLAVMAALIAAIFVSVAAGNRVGVQIESYTPQETASSAGPIVLRFYDEMNIEQVQAAFQIDPPIAGEFTWSNRRIMTFTPSQAMTPGLTYTVTLVQGAESRNGANVLREDFRFHFRVKQPSLIYLAPAGAQERNLYRHNLETGEVTQLTQAPYGIADYAVSPDGLNIAYSLYNEDGTSNIWLYGLATGSSSQLTNCVNASCGAPAWKPDGSQIAYEREEYDLALGQIGAKRVWVVSTSTAQSGLLFEDTQVTGHSPEFSSQGGRLAMFSTNPPAILVYDTLADRRIYIESLQGLSGQFSPDGTQLVYPVLTRGAIGAQFYTQLERLDILTEQRTVVTTAGGEQAIEDNTGVWRPNYPDELAVTRRYLDNRYTDFPQIYLLDLRTNEARPLVVDNKFSHGSITWSDDGNLLAFQRFNRVEQGARPQIWLHNLTTGETSLIANDAFLPGFLP